MRCCHEAPAGLIGHFSDVSRAAPTWVGVLQVRALSSQLSWLPLLAHELTRHGVSLWGASYLFEKASAVVVLSLVSIPDPCSLTRPHHVPLPLLLLLCCASGSSTACVLVVNGTTLSASNLGDSGFVLVRDGVATFQCPQQQHNFNFPFQLGSADSMSDQPQAAMVSEGGIGTSSGSGCGDCGGGRRQAEVLQSTWGLAMCRGKPLDPPRDVSQLEVFNLAEAHCARPAL